MKALQVESTIQKARRAWLDGNAEQFASLFLPDGVLIAPSKQWKGQDAIHKAVVDFASTHAVIRIEIRRIILAGTCAVVLWDWEDMENSTGQRTQAEDAIVIDFEGELIRYWHEYINAVPTT